MEFGNKRGVEDRRARLEAWRHEGFYSRGMAVMAVVQWLRLLAPNAGGPRSIPGQGTTPPHAQLRVRMLQLKIPHAATKTWHSQINE